MAESNSPIGAEGITFQWIRIANAVAQGRITPEEGVAQLQVLAKEHPEDQEWLQDEIETIQQQFGLDVVNSVREGQGSYWDKVGAVMQALLQERLDHIRALELLRIIDADHPEHTEQTTSLIDDIGNSPLRWYLETDD